MKLIIKTIFLLSSLVFLFACSSDEPDSTEDTTEAEAEVVEVEEVEEVVAEIELEEAIPLPEVKLYIFDNGEINGLEPSLFNFTAEEVAETDFVATSYLIVHPYGTLLWEAGMIPDHEFPEDGSPAVDGVTSATKQLLPQLEEIGYRAKDINFLAFSHLHADHNGNANLFARSHWIVQTPDREVMFSGIERDIMTPSNFADLENSQTTTLNNQDYDVFGDGSVKIISAPGHTPGHQVLLVTLPNTGPILLAGDLYHYPEEITAERFPTFEDDVEVSQKSREKIAKIIEETGAQMWIGHDKATHAALNFSPAFYD